MTRLRLAIDLPTADLWSDSARRSMLNVSENLSKLEWEYRPAKGGAWKGRAVAKLLEDGPAWDRLVRGGASGLAWIYWDRDPNAADGLDESTDLLWFGLAEDAAVDRDGSTVSFNLRGAGEFLKRSIYTGTHRGESIHDIADAIFDSMIPTDSGGTGADDNPVKAKDTDNVGGLLRKVSIDFDAAKVDRCLSQLAALAGGPSRVAWGVRPGATSSAFGVAYFKAITGDLYEKEASLDRRMFSIAAGELRGYSVEAKNSDVENVVTVIGDELELDPDQTARRFYSATSICQESVELYGRRATIVRESSLQTDGQCALVAAGECQARASRKVLAKVDASIVLANRVTVGPSSRLGLIQTALKSAGKLVTVRDRQRPLRFWGDSRKAYHAERDASTARYLDVDTSSGPTGSDLVVQDVHNLVANDQRLYVLKGARGSVAYTSQGLDVFEIEKRHLLLWSETSPASGVWRLVIGKRNAAGSWVSLVTSGGTTRTTAQLLAAHTLALEIKYSSAANYTATAYWSDGGTVTQMATATEAKANVSTTGTPAHLLVNGGASGVGVLTPTVAGDCGSADYGVLEVWRDWSGTAAAFLATHDNEPAPFKRFGDLVLHTNFGITADGTATGAAQVRYAFGQATRPFGFDATPINAAASSQFEDVTTLLRRNYAWALGDDLAPAEYGTHLGIIPTRARVRYSGADLPVLLALEGEGGTRPASEYVQSAAEAAAKTEEITRKGSA